MNITWKTIGRNIAFASLCSLAAACVAIVPAPTSSNKANKDDTNSAAPSAVLCNVEGTQEQDLSNGTTKARITHSCKETIVYIENKNPEQAKRCKVLIGEKSTELFIKPGESRKYSQTGAVPKTSVRLDCVNERSVTK